MAAKITGFTPLMDEIIERYRGEGLLQALLYSAIYGKIWRYSQQSRKRCTASQTRIANDLDVGRTVVNRACQRMVKDKLLEEVSNVKGFPIEYITKRGIEIEIALEVEKENQDDGCSTAEQDKNDGCSTVEQGMFKSKTGDVQELNTKKLVRKNKKEIAPKIGAGEIPISQSKDKETKKTKKDLEQPGQSLEKKAFDLAGGSQKPLDFLPSTVRPLGVAFLAEAGESYTPIKADMGLWRKTLNEWTARGFTPDIIKVAVKEMRRLKLTIGGPQSITKIAIGVKATMAIDDVKIYHAGDPM